VPLWAQVAGLAGGYAYDKARRLITAWMGSATPSDPSSAAYTEKIAYNYDDDGNRTSVVVTPYGESPVTTSYTANDLNQYTAVGGDDPAYDGNGNLPVAPLFESRGPAHPAHPARTPPRPVQAPPDPPRRLTRRHVAYWAQAGGSVWPGLRGLERPWHPPAASNSKVCAVSVAVTNSAVRK
jgi:hypothetical protein